MPGKKVIHLLREKPLSIFVPGVLLLSCFSYRFFPLPTHRRPWLPLHARLQPSGHHVGRPDSLDLLQDAELWLGQEL